MNLTAKQQLSRNPSNAGYATPVKTYSVPAMENDDKTISVPAQPVYLIDPTIEPIPMGQFVMVTTKPGGVITAAGAVTGVPAGGLTVVTVPVGKRWVPMSFTSDTTMTATVGNRLLIVRVMTGATIVWMGASSAVVTAAQVGGYDVAFGASNGTPSTAVRRNLADTASTNVQVRENCPIAQMKAGDSIVIDDTANIDVADSCTGRLYYVEYDA